MDHSPVGHTSELHPRIQASLSKLAYRADDYRIQSWLEEKDSISIGATFFNDAEELKLGALPSELRLWSDDKKIKGICVVYGTDTEIAHSERESNPQHVLKLNFDEAITELEV